MSGIRKPSAIRIKEGNRGHRPIPAEARHMAGVPPRPKGMSTNAARIWDRLIEQMDPVVLRRTDESALANLCENEALIVETMTGLRARAEEMKAEAERENRTLAGGAMLALMATSEGAGLMRTLRNLERSVITQRREFGLTPSSRSRVAGSNEPSGQIDEAIFGNAADMLVLQRAN